MVTVGGWYSCGCTRFLNFRISATPFVITTRYEVEGKERFFFFFSFIFLPIRLYEMLSLAKFRR